MRHIVLFYLFLFLVGHVVDDDDDDDDDDQGDKRDDARIKVGGGLDGYLPDDSSVRIHMAAAPQPTNLRVKLHMGGITVIAIITGP